MLGARSGSRSLKANSTITKELVIPEKVGMTSLLFVCAHDVAGDGPAVDFGRTVVNAEGADVLVGAHHHGLIGDAGTAEDLDTAVNDAADGF